MLTNACIELEDINRNIIMMIKINIINGHMQVNLSNY